MVTWWKLAQAVSCGAAIYAVLLVHIGPQLVVAKLVFNGGDSDPQLADMSHALPAVEMTGDRAVRPPVGALCLGTRYPSGGMHLGVW